MRSNQENRFSAVPQANIPRSTFSRTHGFKTTFNSGYLIPFYVDEVLPGDTFNVNSTFFVRLSTPFVPVMDNLYLDFFYFFVPHRLVWQNFIYFMGEERTPGEQVNQSVTWLAPVVNTPAGGWGLHSMGDYFGVPTGITNLNNSVGISAFPFRCYNFIYNEWFRDENLQVKLNQISGDGPDDPANYVIVRRGKRKDYFTSALPWPQKGPGVTIPLGGTAPITVTGTPTFKFGTTSAAAPIRTSALGSGQTVVQPSNVTGALQDATWGATGLTADLSNATAATINSLRQAFQIQRMYERDARGGSRYTELVRSHFGVISPDARLQRPEYLGGGTQRVNFSPVTQTSASNAQPTPQGNLAAIATSAGTHGFTRSFTEHGTIMGLLEARADLNYQQGLNRMWTRRTRVEYYWPVLANLGEQAILNQEIYAQGGASGATDIATFGYQERWAEYRYYPSLITGQFRSTAATPLDVWHLAQKFTALPTLSTTFIVDQPPVSRILAVPTQPEFLMDSFIDVRATRPMPVYSVPGMIDHF